MQTSVIISALLAGVVPSLIWLIFWLREDFEHPEPRWLITVSFLSGAIAVVLSLFFEKMVAASVSDSVGRYTLWALIEEAFKFFVIALIALKTKFNDEPIDAMIYMITIALGFAAVENTLFILEPISNGDLIQGLSTDGMRFISTSLVHVVSSGLIGFFMGLTFYRGTFAKLVSIILGFILAVTLHSIFNLSIISVSPTGTIKVFAWVWVSVVILFLLFEEIKAVKPKNNNL